MRNYLFLSLLISTGLFVFEKTDLMASFFVFVLVFFFLLFGSTQSLILILFMLLLVFITNKKGKDDKRGLNSVFFNMFFPFLAIILSVCNNIFVVVFASTIAFIASDTVSSNVGCGVIYDFTSFKRTDYVSGGITIIGLLGGFVSSLFIGLMFDLLFDFSIYCLFIVIVASFLGNLVDSLLGSVLQIKYKCNVCSIYTDDNEHCKKKCEKVSGFIFFSNSIVNLIASFSSFIVSLLLVLLI